MNSARNNKDFDNGGSLYVDKSEPTECKTDADSWEPRDAVKGDVARMLFYMDTRYEGENGEPELELVDAVNTFDMNTPGKGYHGKLSSLLEWHILDPVDSFEINRNNVIYNYQKNRNPFIDHPEYVDLIWTAIKTGVVSNENQIIVYPNPATDFVKIELEAGKNYKGLIYSLTGTCIMEFRATGSLSLSTDNLNTGSYLLFLQNDGFINRFRVMIVK